MESLFELEKSDLLTLKEASLWATEYLKKNVTESNISYLTNYGRIKKIQKNGKVLISKSELRRYYNSFYGKREINWKNQLGNDLDWHLSFDYLKEADTTKHVHRLHPYKGKFIPQLVEYFLDDHTDEFKKESFFKKGDIVLDPFCGSGTTLVQANELGIHALGIDVSAFNALIANVKIGKYDFADLYSEINKITNALKKFNGRKNIIQFGTELAEELAKFNDQYFPSPNFKYKVRNKEINEKEYSDKKEHEFLHIYFNLVKKYNVKLKQETSDNFLDKWYLKTVRDEIDFVFSLVKKIENINTKKVIGIILSRTIRSCRATTHADLATLKKPISKTYYCAKHGKICKPLFSMLRWWERYSKDTIERLSKFNNLRTGTFQYCLTGDSRTIDIYEKLEKKSCDFVNLIKKQKIKGIFSSPPYVGLIDYHEQHAYAYELFGFKRNDDLEIGPLYKGRGREAQESYIQGISKVLNKCKKYLVRDYNILLVANDKCNLYPIIAEKAGMNIVNKYKRPVLNRTEKDKAAYSETIFHLKVKD